MSKYISIEESFKNEVAQIIKDNIHFAGQVGDYIIYGALEKIWELHLKSSLNVFSKDEMQKAMRDMAHWCRNNCVDSSSVANYISTYQSKT